MANSRQAASSFSCVVGVNRKTKDCVVFVMMMNSSMRCLQHVYPIDIDG